MLARTWHGTEACSIHDPFLSFTLSVGPSTTTAKHRNLRASMLNLRNPVSCTVREALCRHAAALLASGTSVQEVASDTIDFSKSEEIFLILRGSMSAFIATTLF